MKKLITFLLVTLVIGFAHGESDGRLRTERADDLRPTQMVVGLRAVALKKKKLDSLTHDERHKYLRKHPVPVIVGPEGELYMIDHHHLSRAFLETGHHHLYVEVIKDWSRLTPKKFWVQMQAANFAYLRDENGEQISPEDLPDSVLDLHDDPFRSLAYFVREKGGFENTTIPFAEFKWANYFRENIKLKKLKDDWSGSFKHALILSKSGAARSLPGWNGELSCQSIFGF